MIFFLSNDVQIVLQQCAIFISAPNGARCRADAEHKVRKGEGWERNFSLAGLHVTVHLRPSSHRSPGQKRW